MMSAPLASVSTCAEVDEFAWRREAVVAGVAADHNAAGRRVDAIGGVSRDMGGADRADPHVAGGPDTLRLVLWLEGLCSSRVRPGQLLGGACLPTRVARSRPN